MRSRLLWIAATVAAVAILFAIYHFIFSGSEDSEDGHSAGARATSVIGSGDDAVGVSAKGVILVRQPAPADGKLPRLPLAEPPENGRLAGPALQQALVLGAAPAVLRSCIEGSRFGESGVDVELDSGIELRFGSASRATEKWAAAAAILADPSFTEYGYVDLHSPSRVSTGGSGTTLPPPEPGASTSCGE